MGRCGECEHWDRGISPFGVCRNIDIEDQISERVSDLAVLTGGDGRATLWTRENFGCALWEAKESSVMRRLDRFCLR